MHIEPGYVSAAKVIAANAGAVGVIVWGCKEQASEFMKDPLIPVKTLLAAVFFSIFMQSFHMSVGASELHFIGAMAMYLTLGFTPVLLGFALGLLLQAFAFDPQDMYHLGVNSLSLMLPLISVHYLSGRQLFAKDLTKRLTFAQILKLDAMYYAGVTGMVGFWLMIGDVATPFTAWAQFALSYLALVACEPLVTFIAVKGLKAVEGNAIVRNLTVVPQLKLA
ncbi:MULTISPECIES: energy-coupling factor ABC transporter permease [Pseudovibrio]|jgi:ABC-type Co2+ transport system permease subunit|uniref:ABC-type Co2+ transport system, permease component n=1 Tax=Pseudovibrio ascidiaceicola TaxID=285279 RepID=A0A1I3XU90_9HYPH|nr:MULTISPECIES: energy-coupling factor ABC transporter permease [Pseudovibrio]KZK99115.1 cobalt transport protein CbiM [Pseudovibrio sp. Ad26]SFK22576.1 ABC-type Co2+ transport system, permease component [Pseudovibrio ascidiaceicola]